MSYVSSLVLRLSAIVSIAFLSACGGSKIEPTPTVSDPPAISCPALEAQTSPTGQAIPLTFAPTVTAGEAPVTSVCTPASGSSFDLGTTTVSCTATDARQRTASCTFDVQVQPPPRIAVTRFAAFGDSLTEGEDGTSALAAAPGDVFGLHYPRVLLFGREYPTVLRHQLSARYTTQSFIVDNHGCRGEYAGGMSPCYGAGTFARFRATIASGAYEVVLLMEGTNDIYGGTGGNPLGIPGAIGNLRRMVGEARGRGLRVFLATVPPANPATVRGGERYQAIPQLNNEIRQLASTSGATLVDVFAAFDNNYGLLGGDGTHPNTQGYEVIASTFMDAIRREFEIPQTLAPGIRSLSSRIGR